jgi:hypothetical protein
LTLEVGDRFLRMTYRLIIVNNYGKYLQNSFIDKKVMDRTQHIPSNRNGDLEWASATSTLEVGVWLLRMTHRLIIINICDKLFQIPLINDKLWTGHEIYPVTDYVNILPPSVTLTLEVGDQFCAWHIVRLLFTIMASIYKIPSSRTRHIPSNRQCWPWMSKCELDPGGKGLVVAHDTLSYYYKHLCQVISNSFYKWQSYGPDTEVERKDERTDGRSDGAFFYFPHFFLRKGGGQKAVHQL